MKSTIKITRLNEDGTRVFDCHVFAVDGAEIHGDVRIAGDFIGGNEISIEGDIEVDGIVYIGDHCKVKDIFSNEGIFIGDDADTYDLTSPEDIKIGNDAGTCDIYSYGNVEIGDDADIGDVNAINGSLKLGSSISCCTIIVGKP